MKAGLGIEMEDRIKDNFDEDSWAICTAIRTWCGIKNTDFMPIAIKDIILPKEGRVK